MLARATRWAGAAVLACIGVGCSEDVTPAAVDSAAASGSASGSSSTSGAGGSDYLCIPGAQAACACPFGASGVQVCGADGMHFEPCDCPTGAVTSSSAGGAGGMPGVGGAGGGGAGGGGGPGPGGAGGSGGCALPFVDCNGLAADGCEANVLSDSANCGACGHDCQGGGCQGATCQPFVLDGSGCYDVEVAGGYAYYAGSGGLKRVSVNGGAPQLLAPDYASRVALDATDLYWITNDAQGSLEKVPQGGGATTTLATAAGYAFDVVVSGGTAYYSEAWGKLSSIPTIGGVPTVLTNQGGLAYQQTLGLDATHVYWVDYNSMKLASVPKVGGAESILYSGWVGLALAVDGGYAYYQDATGLVRIPTGGGSAQFVTAATDVRGLTVDGSWIYVCDNPMPMQGHVLRAPKAGGNPEVLADTGFVWAVAPTATSIYFCGDVGLSKLAL